MFNKLKLKIQNIINWFKISKKQLIADNRYLISSLDKTLTNLDGTLIILGAIALQHQGEYLVKSDFIQMMNDLSINIINVPEQNGVLIQVVERKKND